MNNSKFSLILDATDAAQGIDINTHIIMRDRFSFVVHIVAVGVAGIELSTTPPKTDYASTRKMSTSYTYTTGQRCK
ncbi:MAG: hypothetical protein LBB36_04095, partial [Fibromonadaceae bacterium]|nr:hypothetical protein [Fibromonadaceae bacterium]